mgnify:CR=1 FL=1
MSAIYYYSIADFSFFFKSYLQRNQIFFRDDGRCCNKRENLDDKRAGKRYFERFCWMLLNMKCSLTENRNYVILFLKNRQEGTKLSPEEEKVQRLEQRIAQLEQALQEKNAPASSQPTVSPTIPQQETPPTIPPPAPEIPPMQTTQPTPPPPSFQQNASWTSQAQTMQSVPPPQRMDTEQKFGKIVMGILASIFIFAAILIGYAFLPSILQMVGLFVIGAGVSAAGLYGISKKKYPYFFLSVAGCGAGILYLSILLSYWYFSVVGKWAMYGMLLLWAVFVLWMSRKSVPLFRLIGQCGIVSVRRPSNRNCLPAVYFALQCDFSADSHGFVYSDIAKSSAYADVWAIACRGHSFDAVHLGTVDLVSHADASGRAKRSWIFFYSTVGAAAGAVTGTVVLFLLGYRKIFAVRPDCRCSLDAL